MEVEAAGQREEKVRVSACVSLVITHLQPALASTIWRLVKGRPVGGSGFYHLWSSTRGPVEEKGWFCSDAN